MDKGPDGLSQQSAPVVVGVQSRNALAVGLGQHRAVQVIGIAFGGVGGVFLRQYVSELIVGIGSCDGGRGNGGATLPTTGIYLGVVSGRGIAPSTMPLRSRLSF